MSARGGPVVACVPMLHVADVARSIAFYSVLGFEVAGAHAPPGHKSPVWAHLQHGSARLMLALADGPFDSSIQAALLYLYFPDIRATHAAVTAAGLRPGPLTFPFYCPEGEFRLEDPDGWVLMLTHA